METLKFKNIKSAASRFLRLLVFALPVHLLPVSLSLVSIVSLLPSQASAQSTDTSSPAAEAIAPQSTEAPTTDVVLPVDPPKKQSQLQATSLTGGPAGAGGDGGLPGVTERVPGMVKVESSGAASYEIRVIVPPGIVSPQLSFAYDSQGTKNSEGSNGLLGMSWALKGLRTIQRCPRTVAQDGFRGAVNYDNNDRFCFDGARLMAINGGAYGANLTEYRTEVDNFIKVISYGQEGIGPAYFKAWTKQGEMMEFGVTEDSRIQAQGKTSVRVWALNRMQDVKGNFFTVTYCEYNATGCEDTAPGEYRPVRIDYTGNTGIPTTRRVEFTYGPRTDATLTYVGGSAIQVTKLLTKVQTFAPPPAGDPAVLVREYRLAYEVGTATRRSRLTSITECAADGSCLPPTTFTWQEGGNGNFITSELPDSPDGWNQNGAWELDVNGDGIIDLVTDNNASAKNLKLITYLSGPNGYTIVTTPAPPKWDRNTVRVGDFDADGKQDLVFVADAQLNYLFSRGDGTYALLALPQPASWSSNSMWAGDWNGDGRTDLVSHNNSKAIFAFSNFINGAGTFSSPVPAAQEPADGWANTKTWIGDISGDGKSDIVTYANGKIITLFNISDVNGTYSTTSVQTPNGWGDCISTYVTCWVADFNGDGKADILSHSNGDGRLHYAFSKGDGTFDDLTRSIPRPANWQSGKVWVSDVNGDGRADLITNDGSAGILTTLFSKGDGTFWSIPVSQPQGFNGNQVWVGDFINGDGKGDLVSHGNNRLLFARANGAYPDLITTITNPFLGVNSITYKSLTDTTVYTKDTDPQFTASYPIVDVQQPIYVVSDMTLSDADNSYPYSYAYAGAKQHYLGRNWLGFRVTDTFNESAGVKSTKFYHQGLDQGVALFDQNFPKIGADQITEIESSSCALPNNLMAHSEIGYTITSPFTSVKRLLQTSIDSFEWECGTTNRHTRRSFSFDSHGNPTQILLEGVFDVAGDEKIEETEWVIDVANWIHKPKTNTFKDGAGRVLRRKWRFYDKQAHGVLTGPGLLTKEEHDGGSGIIGDAANAVFEFDHDSVTGVQTFVKDPRNCETTTAYESTKTYPTDVRTCANITVLNFHMGYTYDPRIGEKISERDWNDQETTFVYDGFGRLKKRTNIKDAVAGSPHGTEEYEYGDWGTANQHVRISKTIEHGQPGVLISDSFFDGFGRVDEVQTDGPSGAIVFTKTTFDSRGLVVEKFFPRFLTEPALQPERFEYDAMGRETKATHPDGRFTSKVYTVGRVTMFDELNRQKIHVLDAYNRIAEVHEKNGPDTYITTYQYNAMDQLVQVQNALGHLSKMEYDRLGRKTAMCDPNMGTPVDVGECKSNPPTPGAWIYAYNPAGDLLTQKDAKNQTLCYSPDELGRPQTKKQGATCATTIATFTYDVTTIIPDTDFPKGQLTQVVDAPSDVTTRFDYDELGRMKKNERVLLGMPYLMQYEYDALGRTKIETFPDGEAVSRTYDGPSLKSISGYINDIQYNGRGQKTSVTYANNLVSTFTYFDQLADTRKNFKIRRHTTSAGLQDLNYDYNDVNNLISVADNVWSGTRNNLQYDDLDRLIHAEGTFNPVQHSVPTFKSCDYTYNSIGNIINKCDPLQPFVYADALHPSAVTFNPITGKSYTYDNNGNMTTRGNQTLTWDFENRVTSVAIPGATTTMEYDYKGVRVKKYAPGASSPTQYPFKGYEIAPDGTITKFIKMGSETLASKKTPPGGQSLSTWHFYHNDHLGGVNLITDINGVKEQLMEYDPWGSVSRSEGPTLGSDPTTDTTHAFTGQELDPETGLYYYGGRYYDAEIARFISPDAIIQDTYDPQNLNRYSYVVNNPFLYVDPTGHIFGIDDAIVAAAVWYASLTLPAKLAVGAAVGATLGAITSAATGQNVGMGALTGAISGAIFAGAGEIPLGGLSGLARATVGVVIHAVAGAASGAINSAITHGNVGMGALTSGLAAGIAEGIDAGFGSYIPKDFVSRFVVRTLVGGVTGGISAEIMGGKFENGFVQGAQTAAIAFMANHVLHETLDLFLKFNGMYKSGQTIELAANQQGPFPKTAPPPYSGHYPPCPGYPTCLPPEDWGKYMPGPQPKTTVPRSVDGAIVYPNGWFIPKGGTMLRER